MEDIRVPRYAPPAKTGIKYLFRRRIRRCRGRGCSAKTDNIETTKKETSMTAVTFTNLVDNVDPHEVIDC